MSQPALKRNEQTASIRPIRPPALPVGDLDVDDQIAALRHNHDGLEKTVAALQRSTKASANDLSDRLKRAESDTRIAHSIAAEVRRDHRQLAKTVGAQTATLSQHNAALQYQALHIADIRSTIADLQQEVADNHLLTASQGSLDELRALVAQIEARENATHGVSKGLVQQVAQLAAEIRLLQATRAQAPIQAPIRRPKVEKPSGSFFLWLSYGAVGVAVFASLIYAILPH